MTSKVKIRSRNFMESKTENESLQDRIRELEDENQNLTARNLLQNRTIVELRNELMLLRIRMSEITDTNSLLRERVRSLVQNSSQLQQQENEGLVIAPPLMAPPPAPPPLPTGRVGAGEALTTPLGISLSSPPRHRVKRDCRQGFLRSNRNTFRRIDVAEPGPSSQSPILLPERPNYFVGLKIVPHFQSFVCPSNETPNHNDSASDSSGSDENSQIPKKLKSRPTEEESIIKKPMPFSRNFDLLQDVPNLKHPKVSQTILKNYNFALPNTNSKFFFSLPWGKKNRDNTTVPSTSGNEVEYFPSTSERVQGENGLRNGIKVSDYAQYTFPTIHEGLHHSGVNTVVTTSRLRKLKKNIPYISSGNTTTTEGRKNEQETLDERKSADVKADTESLLSIDVSASRVLQSTEIPWDSEQDGFQADESSNCMTSTDNSLEKISISKLINSMTKRDILKLQPEKIMEAINKMEAASSSSWIYCSQAVL